MTWLIACERSGRIRDAILAQGIDAVSCDLMPTRSPGPHIQGDVTEHLRKRWTGVIAHPVCRYLSNSGAKHLYIDGRKENGPEPSRWELMKAGAAFFKLCLEANADRVAVENPVMHLHAFNLIGVRATQFIQPWWFGVPMFKATGWHLKGLLPLEPTNRLTPPKPGTDEHKRWSVIHRMPPGPDREEKRSETPAGCAEAYALQWGVGDLVTQMEAA